jgi:hypothetical protein
MAVTIPAPVALGRDTRRRAQARAALAAVLWDVRGRRRLPGHAELSAALDACDRRDVWWVCEMNSVGPVYLLPTREWLRALAATLDGLQVRTVLEVAAGDGFLSACLARLRPRLRVVATDDGSWRQPGARMSRAERRAYRQVAVPGLAPGSSVQQMSATQAVRTYRPELVLVSWAPPGTLVERLLRAPCQHVLDIGVDGDVCGMGPRTWRHAEALLDGPLEQLALCRLDGRGSEAPHTRVTLYAGGAARLPSGRVSSR